VSVGRHDRETNEAQHRKLQHRLALAVASARTSVEKPWYVIRAPSVKNVEVMWTPWQPSEHVT